MRFLVFMRTNSNQAGAGAHNPSKCSGATARRPVAAAAVPCLLLILTLNCRFFLRRNAALPDQRQSQARVQEISRLELQRQGRIRFGAISLQRQGPGKERWKVRYRLQSPISKTADTDIRGFLDGGVKYAFNQGTAYHDRVGRRYEAAYKDEYELKRTLMRWYLPSWPADIRVTSAQMGFWVEQYPTDSPVGSLGNWMPLHLYAYPLAGDWEPGSGGVNKDSFSEAAAGEANWNYARKDVQAWDAPGVLVRDYGKAIENSLHPLAMGLISGGNQRVELRGEELVRYVQQCADRNRSVDVLLKLEDMQEDLWGTETALTADGFGDDHDLHSQRPRLNLEVEIERPGRATEETFLLESGMGQTFPLQEHRGQDVLLFAEVVPDADLVPPAVFVRGGAADEKAENCRWEPLRNPIVKRWDWSQIMVMTPERRITLGDTFLVDITAPWVQPGPRELQSPELVLIAPTGKVHRIRGRSESDLHYRLEFHPDEPGVWRYGWAFRPMEEARTEFHRGEGVFYADLLPIPFGATELEKAAEDLVSVFGKHEHQERSDVLRFNVFVRYAGSFSRRGHAEKAIAEDLLEKVRQKLPKAGSQELFRLPNAPGR